MKYMLLIYGTPQAEGTQMSEEEMGKWWAFNSETQSRGVFISGEALYPVQTATTVRRNDGKIVTTDGPFAETKEVLGGYYILNCKDLDEAIELAGKITAIDNSSIEIRPITEYNG